METAINLIAVLFHQRWLDPRLDVGHEPPEEVKHKDVGTPAPPFSAGFAPGSSAPQPGKHPTFGMSLQGVV